MQKLSKAASEPVEKVSENFFKVLKKCYAKFFKYSSILSINILNYYE